MWAYFWLYATQEKGRIMLAVYAMGISTLCYLVCGVANLRQKDFPHALIWFSYAAANTGFLWYEYIKHQNQ